MLLYIIVQCCSKLHNVVIWDIGICPLCTAFTQYVNPINKKLALETLLVAITLQDCGNAMFENEINVLMTFCLLSSFHKIIYIVA